MFFHENRLYVLSTAKQKTGRTGVLRVYDEKENKIQTEYFEDLNPEGMAPVAGREDPARRNLIITFDGRGNRPSKMLRIGDPQ